MVRDDYDPAKAREYYLRTRKLKGRRLGSDGQPTYKFGGRTEKAASPKTHPAKKKPAVSFVTEKRIGLMKLRLAKLKETLDALLDEAKRRSGVEPTKDVPSDKKVSEKPGSGKAEPTTASEKAAAAKRAKEYREKHPTEESLNEEIKRVEAQIERAKERIRAAAKAARGKAAVQLVSKRPTA